MREVIHFLAVDCIPPRGVVLAASGIGSKKPSRISQSASRIAASLDEALDRFRQLASPRGVLADIPIGEFAEVYHGEGRNEPESPLAGIFPGAENLALFAVTVGLEVSHEITRFFDERQFDVGYLLDAVASSAAEQCASLIEEHFSATLLAHTTAEMTILRYSPGYCGWHITGQKKLFKYLQPEAIGLTLNPSCLMEPLKSVSGAIVAGRPGLHRFDDSYAFCSTCATHECRDRITGITSQESVLSTRHPRRDLI